MFGDFWSYRVRRFLGILGERIGGRHGVLYSPITVSEAYNGGKNGGKLWRPELY